MRPTLMPSVMREYLRQDAGVAALVGENVFAGELPRRLTKSWTPDYAQAAVVVEADGGASFGFSASSWAHVGGRGLRTRCFGPTNAKAEAVDAAVRWALKELRPPWRASDGTIVKHVQMGAGPNGSLREPGSDWIFVLSGYQVTLAETRPDEGAA
jgi:hypothetical protein